MPAISTSATAISRLPKVQARTGLPKSSIYALIARGDFPKPIKIGRRAVGWLDSDIDAWIEAQVSATRGQSAAEGV